jgi:L-ascorbate metabolism protein UlaG (beta-lactamase superfamily)
MRGLRLLVLGLVVALVVCGCKKEEPETEQEKPRKEVPMGNTLQWLGHASFKIRYDGKVIYIDPWKLSKAPHDATLVLVSHSHSDHYSAKDIAKAAGPDTKIIASADVVKKEGKGQALTPAEKINVAGVTITGVAAYNINKRYHPKANNWLGFLIDIGSVRIYYAGDTDLTEEMKTLKDIDIALLPVGGTYTMNAEEAATAVDYIKPGRAIPYHWGDIVGKRADAERFAENAKCEVTVLKPGESIEVTR